MTSWASDFYEIPEAIDENDELRDEVLELVETDPIHGKVTEGDGRTDALRGILTEFFEGEVELREAFEQVSKELPQHESQHSHNNRVFPENWEERLVRTQASRFYNQAALRLLQEQNKQRCYIPHSSEEKPDSPCTLELAGSEADVEILLDRLERGHRHGNWHDEVYIPEHPHCTHTVVPLSQKD